MNEARKLEFMVRVRLPILPDGITHHVYQPDLTPEQRAYQNAIFAAKPFGFEVRWPEDGKAWPVDSDGYTYVPLFISTTEAGAVNVWIDRYYEARDQLSKVAAKAKELLQMTGGTV